MLGCLDSWI